MEGMKPYFGSLRKYTLNFRPFELQILSDTNQEFHRITILYNPTSEKIYSVIVKRRIWLIVCIKNVIQKITGLQYC